MNSLLILIPIALVLLGVAVWAFVWAVDHQQFEDLDEEGQRILFDDFDPANPANPANAPDGTSTRGGDAPDALPMADAPDERG